MASTTTPVTAAGNQPAPAPVPFSMPADATLDSNLNRKAAGATTLPKVKLDAKQERAWLVARTKFLGVAPALGHLLYTLLEKDGELAYFTDAVHKVPVAATDGRRLYINPTTFFALKLDEQVFVIAHEIAHCMLDHCGQSYAQGVKGEVTFADGTKTPFNHDEMNQAQDLVINDMLIESGIGTFNARWLHDKSIATAQDSAFDAFRKITKGQKPDGEQFDGHLPPDDSEPRSDIQWQTEIAAGMAAAKAMGKLPAAMEAMFGELLNPTVPWGEQILAFVHRCVGAGGFDWRRPDRRMICRADPIIVPGRSGYGAGTIVVGVDDSGSIYADPTLIDRFMSELVGIFDELRPKRLVVMWCDAAVNRVDEAEESADLNDIRSKGACGGGGTNFIPVFEEVEAMGLDPDLLIYLTDGYGTFPDAPPRYPVLWGTIELEKEGYPFGQVVEIPKQDAA